MANAKAAKLSSAEVVPNPKVRLLDQVREVIRFKHYSIGTSGWNREARQLPFAASFVRHAPFGIRLRHSHGSRVARTQGCEHDANLHACHAEARPGGEESVGWRVAALGVGDRIYPPLAHPGRGMGNAEGEGSQIRTSNIEHRTSNIQRPTSNTARLTTAGRFFCGKENDRAEFPDPIRPAQQRNRRSRW